MDTGDAVKRMYKLSQERKLLNEAYELARKDVLRDMLETGIVEFSIPYEGGQLVVTLGEQARISYDPEKLKQTIDPKVFSKITESVVVPAKIQAAVELGEIEFTDVQSAATVSHSDVVRVRYAKHQDPEFEL